MSQKTGKELLIEWFNRVWNSCEVEAIHELMSENCEVKGLDLHEKGPKGFIPLHSSFCEAFESINIEMIEMAEENNFVAGHARFTGRHKPTGKEVDIIFSVSAKWEDGKLVEARNVVDYTSLLSQLNLFDNEQLNKIFKN